MLIYGSVHVYATPDPQSRRAVKPEDYARQHLAGSGMTRKMIYTG